MRALIRIITVLGFCKYLDLNQSYTRLKMRGSLENAEKSKTLSPCKIGNFGNFDEKIYGVKHFNGGNNYTKFCPNQMTPCHKVVEKFWKLCSHFSWSICINGRATINNP